MPPLSNLWMVLPMIAALVLLGGCAHQITSTTTAVDWEKHQARILQLSDWQLVGKLGAQVPRNNGSATLRWNNNDKTYSLDLSGPFGQGRMLISGKPGKVTLQQAGDAPLIADSAEALIHQATGWTLPVEQLAYWVRGIPAPQWPVIWMEKNEAGLLGTLQQLGWEIHYSNYREISLNNSTKHSSSVQLPGKIIASYNDIRLTLIIRQWQLNH